MLSSFQLQQKLVSSFFLVSAGRNEKPSAVSVVSQQPMIISGRVFPYCKEKMDEANKPHQSAAMVTEVVDPRIRFSEQLMIRFTRLPPTLSLEVQAKATLLKQDMLKIMTKDKKLGR